MTCISECIDLFLTGEQQLRLDKAYSDAAILSKADVDFPEFIGESYLITELHNELECLQPRSYISYVTLLNAIQWLCIFPRAPYCNVHALGYMDNVANRWIWNILKFSVNSSDAVIHIVHKNQHFMTVIFLPGRMGNGKRFENVMFMFNSLPSCGIADEYACDFIKELKRQTGIDLDNEDCRFFDVTDMPRQRDGYSCGLFAFMVAAHFIFDETFRITLMELKKIGSGSVLLHCWEAFWLQRREVQIQLHMLLWTIEYIMVQQRYIYWRKDFGKHSSEVRFDQLEYFASPNDAVYGLPYRRHFSDGEKANHKDYDSEPGYIEIETTDVD